MRLTIPDLAIGKSYQAQVRAKSGTEAGQWSPILDIPAVYETTPPADLIGSNISVAVDTGNSGDTFIATWTYTQPKDFDHYEYRWYGSSDNSTYVRSIIFSTTTPSATLTFSENTSLFGGPKSWMKIEVRAVNTSGLTSTNWVVSSTPVQQLPPPAPTNFTAISGPDVIKLEWTTSGSPLDIQNVEYYKIEVSTDGTNYTEAAKVKYPTLKYSYDTTYYDKKHYFRISSVGRYGSSSSTVNLTGTTIKVSPPSVMNGLISNIVSYSRTAGSPVVTYVTKDPHGLSSTSKIYVHGTRSKSFSVTSITGNGQLTATTSAAHGFSTGNTFEIVGSPNDIFNERGVINAVTTNTFSYQSSSSGTFVSPATAYVVDGTSTVDTIFGDPVAPTIISTTSISCSPNSGTGAISVGSSTYTITNASGTGGVATYTYTGPGILPGQRVTIQDVNPDQYNLTDALVISTPTSSTFTIESEADGAYVAAGTVISRPFGDIYPSDNAVRIKDDGITIGNMGNGFVVGISPTSFNMQSSGSSTRLALTSSHIDMYKDGNKTVQFDGKTGDATIVGKFSTGFSPDPRIEINSGFTEPEIVTFYSGLEDEESPAYVRSSIFSNTPASFGIAGTASNLVTIPDYTYIVNTTGNIYMPLSNATVNVNSTTNFPTGGGQFDLTISSPGVADAAVSFIYSSVSGNSFIGVTGGSGLTDYYYSNDSPVGCSVYFTYNSPWVNGDLAKSGDIWIDKMGLTTTVTGASIGSYLGASDAGGGTALTVASTSGFPSSGSLLIYSSVYPTADPEYATYTGKTNTSFTGVMGGGGSVTGGTIVVDANSLSQISYERVSPGGTEKTVTGPSPVTSSIRTITATSHGFNVGDRVIIYGFTSPNTAYNETAIVRSIPSTNTFTYKSTVTSGSPSSYTGARARLFDSVRGVHIDNLNGLLDNTINAGNKVYIFPNRSELIVSSASVNNTYSSSSLSPSSIGSSSIVTSANLLPSYVKLKGTTVYNKKIVTQPNIDIVGNIRLLTTGDAGLTSTTHALQIGATSSYNLIIDNNEIMSRKNGGITTLYLNGDGGNVSINSTAGSDGTLTMGNSTGTNYTNLYGTVTVKDSSALGAYLNCLGSITTFSKSGTAADASPGVYLNDYVLVSRNDNATLYQNRYSASNSAANIMTRFLINDVVKADIVVDTGVASFSNTSDHRIKTNLEPITYAIEKMKLAKAYTYNLVEDPSGPTLTGFIAHELSEVMPRAVRGEKDAVDENGEPVYQTISDTYLIPLMAQAIHDLIDKVEFLEEKINLQGI